MRKSVCLRVSLSLLSACLMLAQGVAPALAADRPDEKARGGARSAAARTTAPVSPSPGANITRFLRVEPSRPEGVAAGQSATLMPDGRWLLLGGEADGGVARGAYLKDERTGATQALAAEMRQARAWHSATLMPDGSVLVLGGVGTDGRAVVAAELLNPETQQFEELPAGGLSPRSHHTATLLTEGLVLVAGGAGPGGQPHAGVELWSPRTRSAKAVSGRLQHGRTRHVATLQADGSVLLWGGVSAAGASLDDGELFEPEGERLTWAGVFTKYEDDNAPYLRASLPKDGATDAPVEGPIALRFSKALRVETVTPRTVTLGGPQGPVEARVTPAEGGMLAFILPRAPLAVATTYTVTLADATDERDRPLTYSMLSFTTAGAARGDAGDGEDWTPDARNMRGDWRSNRPESHWQKLPPLEAPAGVTAVSGRVLLLNGNPLPNVLMRIGGRTALTDNSGRFLVTDLQPGHHVMVMDGRPASGPRKVYGYFKIGVDVEAGKTNVLPYTNWMPRIDTEHAARLTAPTATEVSVTTPYIPGLEVRIPQGAVVRDTDGQTVTQLSITPIPVDRTPFPLPPGVAVPVFFTVQPGASVVIPPRARVIYPNYTNERPGTRMNFWNYDAEGRGWYIYGQGTVTPNGRQVVPDPGVVLYEFTGFMINRNGMPPPPGSGPGAGSDATGGDPVDLATGLFVHDKVDMAMMDILPLTLKRTYRPEDTASRAFGIGTSHTYDLYLFSAQEYVEVDLVLPSGGRVHYVRISSGTGFTDAEFEHTATNSIFYRSRVKWNGNGWNLTLKSGLTFVFGDEAPLNTIKDRHGNKITIARASSNGFGSPTGPVTRVTSSTGRWIEFVYDGSNRVTQARDNLGRAVNYTYDAGGRLWKVTDPNNGVTEYTYDASNRMLTIKDPNNVVFLTNLYDANGRITKQTQADGTTFLFAYTLDAAGKITQTDMTDPRGIVRRTTFDTAGHTTSVVAARGATEQQTFSYQREAATGLVLSATDPLSRQTSYTYDTMGNVTELRRLTGTADQTSVRMTYEPKYHKVASVTNPLNRTVSFGYDTKGNITSVTNPNTQSYTFAYNPTGQLVSASDPLGNTARMNYDGGDLAEVLGIDGHTATQFLDSAGRVLSRKGPTGQGFRYEYDALNRPLKIVDPHGGEYRFTYDANGNLLTVTDPRNGVTAYTYNNMNRPVTRRDALQRTESYEYDANGNLTKITDRRGKVTTFRYDNLNRRTFAGFGTVVGSKNTTYESSITYTYDAGNRLTKVVDTVGGTENLTYDARNRLTSKSGPRGTISYTYDAANRQTSMTVAGQPAVNYAYDDLNRLTAITQGSSAIGFTYDAANRRRSLSLPNGITVEYGYNNRSLLTGITYKKGAAVLGNLAYERDSLGNRTQVGGSFARMSPPQAVSSLSYNAANQLTQRGGAALTYDANGNLTGDGTNTYTWDARNHLASVSGPGLTASFKYDSFGRRYSKTVNGVTTDYLHDGYSVVQELSGGSPVANQIVGGMDEVYTRAEGGATRSLLTDGLGTTVALADAGGAIQTEFTYDPFGNATTTGAAPGNVPQFTGRDNDGTGLYYYRARYYHPRLQRFVSEDPIGFAGGINLYAYVGNNPINWSDPLGLDGGNGFLDGLQLALDIGGMIPGLGEPLDLINAGISALRGDYVGAGLSLAGAIPLAGNVATGAKLLRKGANLVGDHGDDLAVIGRQVDTAVAKDWPGHSVLDIPDWTLGKNDAWVQSAIDRNATVYLASPQTQANMWDSVNNRQTVFGREFQQFLNAGYRQVGDYLVPPGR